MTEKERLFIARLYAENYEKLFVYAMVCVKDRAAAEDIVTETFVSAIKKAASLISHDNPHGWLREAVKFEIKMYQRDALRSAQMIPYDTVKEQCAAQSAAYDDHVDLLLSKSGLTEMEQQECRMYFLDDCTHEQVARKLGITVSASQKRRERLRKKLKIRWEK